MLKRLLNQVMRGGAARGGHGRRGRHGGHRAGGGGMGAQLGSMAERYIRGRGRRR
jgi:hypothetical protein